MIDFPLVMRRDPSLPAKTIADLVAHAKANPGKISYCLIRHRLDLARAGELFKMIDRRQS